MNNLEVRSAVSLASVFALRMMGLFMIMPVMMNEGMTLEGATPSLLGLAIGIYGLSQALLQIPMGYMSDKWGRKPIIYAGLLMFFVGSLVAAYSTSVYGVILGRFLQGSGAIASTIMALATDLTRDQNRSKVLAIIGSSIGLAFVVAIVAGPILSVFWGLGGLFYITAVFAVIAACIVVLIPSPLAMKQGTTAKIGGVFIALRDSQLLRLNFSVFVLHFSLTAIFVIIPLSFKHFHLEYHTQSLIYAATLVGGFIAMMPLLIWAEKRFQHVKAMYVALGLFIASFMFLIWGLNHLPWMIFALCLYFFSFNFFEAMLPSLISRVVIPSFKGSALGAFSTSQFLGAFLGGTTAGLFVQWDVHSWVLIMVSILTVLWFMVLIGLKSPPQLVNITLHIKVTVETWNDIARALTNISGIHESTMVPDENLVYVRAKKRELSRQELESLPFVQSIS